jgi:hypothetical protein
MASSIYEKNKELIDAVVKEFQNKFEGTYRKNLKTSSDKAKRAKKIHLESGFIEPSAPTKPTSLPIFSESGLIPEDRKLSIEKIISHDSGSKNLKAFHDYIQWQEAAHIKRKLPLEQIAKMLDHNGGAKNLQAFCDHIQWEETAHIPHKRVLSVKQIVKMLDHNGAKNLQAFRDHIEREEKVHIPHKKKLSIEQHEGGSLNLRTEEAQPSQQGHFSKKQTKITDDKKPKAKTIVLVKK